jgi:hypothetical protein
MLLSASRLNLRTRRSRGPDGAESAEMVLGMSIGYRVMMAAMGAMLIAGMLVATGDGGRPVTLPGDAIPLAIIALCLFGAAYRDCWIFKPASGTCERQIGLAFLFKRTGIPLSSIRCVEVSEYLRGGPIDSAPLDPSRYAPSRLPLGRSKPRSFVTLSLIDAEERTIRIDHSGGATADRMVTVGRELATFIGVDLVDRTAGSAPPSG